MDIRVEKLFFQYDQEEEALPALQDVSFSLRSGECVALLGPSGSGKSTLAQHLNGLLKPDRGHIWVDGRLLRWSPSELKALRRRVGLVFQFPEAQIFEASVFAEVAFAARQWGIPAEEIPGRVEKALAAVGLDAEGFGDRNPLKLSGGEARLISVASLLVVDPDWLILDEPTLGLDLAHWRCIRDLIEQRTKASRSVLLITHDFNLVLQACPRTLVINEGRITYDGPTSDLLINYDLGVEFGLAPPEVIVLWNALKTASEQLGETGPFPNPDPEELTSWVAQRPAEHRNRLCSVLQQHLRSRS